MSFPDWMPSCVSMPSCGKLFPSCDIGGRLVSCEVDRRLMSFDESGRLLVSCGDNGGQATCGENERLVSCDEDGRLVPFPLWGKLLPWLYGTLLSSSASKLLKQIMVYNINVVLIRVLSMWEAMLFRHTMNCLEDQSPPLTLVVDRFPVERMEG